MSETVLPELLDTAAVATYLGVSPRTVEREVAAGRLPFTRAGKRLRFTRERVRQYQDVPRPASGDSDRCSYVYVIGPVAEPCRPLKIGIATSPADRLKTLQVGNPLELAIHRSYKLPARAAAERVERSAHRAFAKQNVRGEWFDADLAMVSALLESVLGIV